MKPHTRTGATHGSTRRYARLFSTVEMAVAMSILLVISLGVTFTLTRTLSQTERATQQQGADTALSIAMANASSQGYAALADDSFERLDACDAVGAPDPAGEFSCISVAGRTYQVSYEVLTPESPEFAEEAEKQFGAGFGTDSEGLFVRVSTEVIGGNLVTQTRRVAPPIAGFTGGYGALRVSVETTTGAKGPVGIELHLLDAAGQPVAAAANPLELNEGGSVVFVVPDGVCLRAAPCQVGISDGEEWWRGEPLDGGEFEWGIAGAEGRAGVVVPSGGEAETTVVVFEAGEIEINLYASGVDEPDLRIPAKDAGSICLWLTFIDDGRPKSVPTCNFDDASQVLVHSYAGEDGEYLIPSEVDVTISVDHPDETCPAVDGMKGHTAYGWDFRAVCTSWTWGYPSLISTPGDLGQPDLQPFSEEITVLFEGGRGYEYDLIWAGDSARPAAGYTGEGQWLRPREALGCSLDGTCQPLGEDNVPEARDCPDGHCYSTANARPEAIGPSGEVIVAGEAEGVDIEAGSPLVLEIGGADADRDPLTLTILEVPEAGYLSFNNEEVEVGDEIFTDKTEPAIAQLVYYSSPSDSDVQRFRFKVTDTHNANSCELSEDDPLLGTTPEACQTVNLVLDATAVAEIIGSAEPEAVYQGGEDSTISILVLNGHGQPMEGVTVTLEAPDGVQLAEDEVVTNADGEASTVASFEGSTPGIKQIKLSADGRVGEAFVEVLATAQRIWGHPATVRQGSGDAVVVEAADEDGNPAPGIPVTLGPIEGPVLERDSDAYDGEGSLVGEDGGRFIDSPLFKALMVGEGTGNLVLNPGLEDTEMLNLEEVEWDDDLNGDVGARAWSSGFSGEAVDGSVGYHAHINTTAGRGGGTAWEFIDENTAFGEAHRPLKARQQLAGDPGSELGWEAGTQVTVSFDLKTNHADKWVRVGIEHSDGEEIGYGDDFADLAPGVVDEWQRVQATFTLSGSEWDFAAEAALVIEGHHADNGTEARAWVDNIQVETGAQHRGYHDEEASGGRTDELVAMPGAGVISPESGTLSLVFSPLSSASDDGVLFGFGSVGEDNLQLAWNSVLGDDTIRFTVSDGTTTRNVDVEVAGGLEAGEWYRVVARWDLPNTLALGVHQFGGGTWTSSGTAAGVSPDKGGGVRLFDGVGTAYVGWDGDEGWANVAIDELSVARVYRDDSMVNSLLASELSEIADEETTFLSYFSGTDFTQAGLDLGEALCITELDGTCQGTVSASQDTAAGTYRLTVTSGGLVGYGAVTVEQVAQQIAAPALVGLRQKGSAELEVIATDGAGVPLAQRPLTFSESSGRFRFAGDGDDNGIVEATTDTSGRATVVLFAEDGALPGVETEAVSVSDTSSSVTVDVEIIPAPGSVDAPNLVMEPATFTDYEVIVYDDNNNPLSGEPVRLTSTEVTLFGVGNLEDEDPWTDVSTTDENGVAVFRIFSAFEAAPGLNPAMLELQAGDLDPVDVDVEILQRIFSVEFTEDIYEVDQGSQVQIEFVAYDNLGNPVDGADIDDPSAAELAVNINHDNVLAVPATVSVDANGEGSFTIMVGPEAASGFVNADLVGTRAEFQIGLLINPVLDDLSPVEDPVIIHRDLYGRIGFRLVDLAGAGVAGETVTITSTDPDLELSPMTGFLPLGWWRLGESLGPDAVDRSTNGHDATYAGDVTLGQPGALNGSANTAVSFGAGPDSGHIVLPLGAGAQLAESFTFSSWVRIDEEIGEGNYGYIVWGGDTAPEAMYLRVSGTTGELEMGIGEVEEGTDAILEEDQWYHVAWVVNDDPFDAGFDTSFVYVNGELVRATLDEGIAAGRPDGQLQISDATNGFEASFDEVAIWNIALGGANIASQYETGVSGDPTTVTGTTDGEGVLWTGAIGTGVDGEFEVEGEVTGLDPATLTVVAGLGPAQLRVIPDNPVFNPSFDVGNFDGWEGGVLVGVEEIEWQQTHVGHDPVDEWWPLGRGSCQGWDVWNNFDADGSPTPTAEIEVRDPVTLDELTPALEAGAVLFIEDASSDEERDFEWRELPSGNWETMEVTRDLSECGLVPETYHGTQMAVIEHDGESFTSLHQADSNLFPVSAGDMLTLSVRLYADSPGLWANGRISLYDIDGEPLAGGTHLVRTVDGADSASYQEDTSFNRDTGFVPNGQWDAYRLTATAPVPEGAAFARVEVFTESEAVGKVYVDDVQVAFANKADITVEAGGSTDVEVELLNFLGEPIAGGEVEISEDAPDADFAQGTVTTGQYGRGTVTLTVSPEADTGDYLIDLVYEDSEGGEGAESQHSLKISGGEAPGLRAVYYELDGGLINIGQGDGVAVSASSEKEGSPASATADGIYGEGAGYADEWRSDGETAGASVVFDLGSISDIAEVWLYDRADASSNFAEGSIEFSLDGEAWFGARQFAGLDPEGEGMRIEVGQTAQYVRVTAGAGAAGSDVGLAEVKILGGVDLINLARTSRVSVSASSELSGAYLADNAVDGDIPGAGINKSFPHREWATQGGSGAGNYLEVDLGRDAWVHAITVYDRPGSSYFGDFELRVGAANSGGLGTIMVGTDLADDGSGTTYLLDRPTQMRYLQLYTLDAVGTDVGLAEIEIWGSFTGPGPGDGTAFAERVVPTVEVGGSTSDIFGSGRDGQVAVELDGDISITDAGEYTFYVDGMDDVSLRVAGEEMVSYVLTEGAGWEANGLVVGDFTGDGIDDQAVVDGPRGDVWVQPGSANGVSQPQLWASGGVHPEWDNPRLFVGDFDGDDDDDLAVVYGEGNGEVWVLESDGTGFSMATVWGSLGQNLVHFTGQSGVAGVAGDDESLDLADDFTIEMTARADWSEPHGRQLLVSRADADEFSWGLYLNTDGHLELVTAADPDAEASKVFTSTEPVSVLAESGQLRSIRVGLDREVEAVTATFTIDGIPLGDPVVFELIEAFDLWNGSAPITIGHSEWDDTTLRGDIQRVALFSDLSASELVFEWDATEAAEDAETIADSSANGIDLTLTGTKVANTFFASRNGNAVLDLTENTTNYNVVGIADDTDSLDVEGEFAIEFVGRADWTQISSNQTLVSKWAEADGSRAYYLEVTDDGELQLWISADGINSTSYLSTEALGDALPGLADGDRLNITASFTANGAGGDSEVRFFANGVQVGDTVEGPTFADLELDELAAGGVEYAAQILASEPLGYWDLTPWAENGGQPQWTYRLWDISDKYYVGVLNDDAVGAWQLGPHTQNRAGNRLHDLTLSAGLGYASDDFPNYYYANFDNANDRAHILNFGALNGADAFSYSGWVRLNPGAGQGHGIFSYAVGGGADANELLVYHDTTGLRFYRGNAATTPEIELRDGEWHHLAVTWDGTDGETKFYVDGVEEQTATLASGTTIGNDGTVVFGEDQDGKYDGSNDATGGFAANQAFLGGMGPVAVYDRVLDPSEIEDHYQAAFQDDAMAPQDEESMDALFESSNPYTTLVDSGAYEGTLRWHSSIPGRSPIGLDDFYALEIEGGFYAPEAGNYTFGVDADDQIDLYIDDELVVGWYSPANAYGDGGGSAMSGDPGDHSQTVALTKGWHDVKVRTIEGWGDEGVHVNVVYPGADVAVVMPTNTAQWVAFDTAGRYKFQDTSVIPATLGAWDNVLAPNTPAGAAGVRAETYEEMVRNDGAIAHYPFDSTAGRADIINNYGGTGSAFNRTAGGGGTGGSCTAYTNSGGALPTAGGFAQGSGGDFISTDARVNATDFNGTTHGITYGDVGAFDITGNLTLEMWLWADTLAERTNPIGKAYGGPFMITQEPAGNYNFYHGNTGCNSGTAGTNYESFNSSATIQTGRWNHVVVTRNGNTLRWYINGVETNSKTAVITSRTASNLPFTIGQGYVGHYDGKMAHVAVYNTALNATQVAQHYDAGTDVMAVWAGPFTEADANWDGSVAGDRPGVLPEDRYAFEIGGMVYAPQTGTYTFSVNSDDASQLFVNGQIASSKLGSGGASGDFDTRAVGVALEQGWHHVLYRGAEGWGGDIFIPMWKFPDSPGTGANLAWRPIPFSKALVEDLSGSGVAGLATSNVFFNGGGVRADGNGSATFTRPGSIQFSGVDVDTSPGAKHTVEFWVNYSATTPAQTLVSFDYYALMVRADGTLGFNTSVSDYYGIPASEWGKYRDSWTHVVAEFTNGDVTQNRLWLNGVEQSLSQQVGTPNSSNAVASSHFSLSSIGHNLNLDGIAVQYDELAIYEGTLSEAEIQARYRAGAYEMMEDVVLADGPIAYWPLDSDHGFGDATGNGHTLTAAGGITAGNHTRTGTRESSETRHATRFDGNDDLLSLGAGALPLSGDAPHTLEVWARTVVEPVTRTGPAVLGPYTTGGHHILYNYPGGEEFVQIGRWGGSPSSPNGTVPIPAVNTYTHWVSAYDGTTLRVYRNGEMVYESVATNPFSLDGSIRLGDGVPGEANFNGALAHVAVYDRALSEEEAKTHFRVGTQFGHTYKLDRPDDSHYFSANNTSQSLQLGGSTVTIQGDPVIESLGIRDDNATGLRFDGVNDWAYFDPSDTTIGANGALAPYGQKTFHIAFAADHTGGTQYLYKQGAAGSGLGIYIHNGSLYANAWGVAANNAAGVAYVSAPIEAHKTYVLGVNYNGTDGEMELWLNGRKVAETSDIGTGASIPGTSCHATLGASWRGSRTHDLTTVSSCVAGDIPQAFFAGTIMQWANHNRILSDEAMAMIGEDGYARFGALALSSHPRNAGFENGEAIGWRASEGVRLDLTDTRVGGEAHSGRRALQMTVIGDGTSPDRLDTYGVSQDIAAPVATIYDLNLWVYPIGVDAVTVSDGTETTVVAVTEDQWNEVTLDGWDTDPSIGNLVLTIAPGAEGDNTNIAGARLLVDDISVSYLDVRAVADSDHPLEIGGQAGCDCAYVGEVERVRISANVAADGGLGSELIAAWEFDRAIPGSNTVIDSSGSSNTLSFRAGNAVDGAFPAPESPINRPLGADLSAVVVADIDGDGTADLASHDPAVFGNISVLVGGAGHFTEGEGSDERDWELTERTLFAGHVDAGAEEDLIWFHHDDDTWTYNLGEAGGSVGDSASGTSVSTAGTTPQVADVDGDGQADALNYNPASGKWMVRLGNGSGWAAESEWGTFANGSTQLVEVGDFDGDGSDDVAGYHTGTGEWQVGLSDSGSFDISFFGTQDELASLGEVAVGDFDGDGDTDVVYLHTSPANHWRQLASSGSGFGEEVVVYENTEAPGTWECRPNSTQTYSGWGDPSDCATIYLEAGKHSLWLWAQKSNLDTDASLRLAYSGPDTGDVMTPVPANVLTHFPPVAPLVIESVDAEEEVVRIRNLSTVSAVDATLRMTNQDGDGDSFIVNVAAGSFVDVHSGSGGGSSQEIYLGGSDLWDDEGGVVYLEIEQDSTWLRLGRLAYQQ